MKLKLQEPRIQKFISSMSKEDIRKFIPRPCATPHNHLNHSYMGVHAAFKLQTIDSENYNLSDEIKKNRKLLFERMVFEEFPSFYIGEEFFDAIENTHPPDFKLNTLHLPRSPITFVLPFGKMQIPYENTFASPSFITMMKLGEKFISSHWMNSKDDFLTEVFLIDSLSTFNELCNPEIIQTLEHYGKRVVPYDKIESLITRTKIFSFKLLLILNTRPKNPEVNNNVLMPVVYVPQEEKKNKKFYSPLWIGEKYKIPNETSGQHHASPIIHYRRGHIRCQRYGPELSLQRIIWIEPTIVGANTKET